MPSRSAARRNPAAKRLAVAVILEDDDSFLAAQDEAQIVGERLTAAPRREHRPEGRRIVGHAVAGDRRADAGYARLRIDRADRKRHRRGRRAYYKQRVATCDLLRDVAALVGVGGIVLDDELDAGRGTAGICFLDREL